LLAPKEEQESQVQFTKIGTCTGTSTEIVEQEAPPTEIGPHTVGRKRN
jgi:hypothetical protein